MGAENVETNMTSVSSQINHLRSMFMPTMTNTSKTVNATEWKGTLLSIA